MARFHNQMIYNSKDVVKNDLPRVVIVIITSQFSKLMEWIEIRKIEYFKNGT